jgi:hypothetical protein
MQRRELLLGMAGLTGWAAAGCMTAPLDAAPAESHPLDAAFFYAYPLYELTRTAQTRTGGAAGAPVHRVAHRAALADHTSRQVTAPNNDTIYSSAFLDLSGGAVELIAPTDIKRYFSIAFMNAFTDNFAYIGTRATGGQGGRFWIVGPTWTGAAPTGVNLIRSDTNDVWMLGRILVDGPSDLAAARALQQQIALTPAGEVRPYGVRCTRVEDGANFLAVVNDMLERSARGGGHVARARLFGGAGIGAGVAPSAAQVAAWNDYIPIGIGKLREKFLFRELVVNGWGYQPPGVGEAGASDFLRAAIALGGLAALGEDEAMYLQATLDGSGQALTGDKNYRWRIPSGGVPADAFWSLTMYQAEPDGRFFLVENPINRFSIGDRTPGLVKNADGGVDVLIQRDAPTGALAANWLPAAAGPMRLSLRAYLPGKALRDRSWRAPPIVRV